MYILTISEETLQSESNRFCCHKAGRRVNNDPFEDLVSAADLASMGSLEIIIDRREVLEERGVEVVLIGVQLCRQNRWSMGSWWNRSLAGESAGSTSSRSAA